MLASDKVRAAESIFISYEERLPSTEDVFYEIFRFLKENLCDVRLYE